MLRTLMARFASNRKSAMHESPPRVTGTALVVYVSPEDRRRRMLVRQNEHVPTELKFATYRQGSICVSVAYAIFHGNRCVFSAVNDEGGSTINQGEYLARVIARREHRLVQSLRFYDLQTMTGYGVRLGGYRLGYFEFDEICLVGGELPRIHAWKATQCPLYVSDLFREYIGGPPHQVGPSSVETDF